MPRQQVRETKVVCVITTTNQSHRFLRVKVNCHEIQQQPRKPRYLAKIFGNHICKDDLHVFFNFHCSFKLFITENFQNLLVS